MKLVVLILLLSLTTVSAADELLLQAGDTVEMTVTGVQDLTRRTTVAEDGVVSLPLFGDIKVSGLSPSQVRTRLKHDAPGKSYRPKLQNPNGQVVSITAEDVFFDLIASRPVYVHGDVGKPGEVTYRPDLTVRQAVTLAGGYDVARLRQADPFIEMENARTDYAALWIAFAHQQATVWRLEAELKGRDDIGHTDIPTVPVDPELVSQILRTEKKQLSLDLSDHVLDREQLAKTLKETERQIATLEERDDMQTAELAAARAELDNLKELDKKGLAQSTRISDARRAILLTSSQQLETTVEKLRATVERDGLARRYDTLDAEREVTLLEALKDARLELETTRTGLRSAGQKLLYAGLLQSDLVRRHAPAEIIIHRSDPEGEPQSMPASEDARLMPGDVVEVKLELPRELFTTQLN